MVGKNGWGNLTRARITAPLAVSTALWGFLTPPTPLYLLPSFLQYCTGTAFPFSPPPFLSLSLLFSGFSFCCPVATKGWQSESDVWTNGTNLPLRERRRRRSGEEEAEKDAEKCWLLVVGKLRLFFFSSTSFDLEGVEGFNHTWSLSLPPTTTCPTTPFTSCFPRSVSLLKERHGGSGSEVTKEDGVGN